MTLNGGKHGRTHPAARLGLFLALSCRNGALRARPQKDLTPIKVQYHCNVNRLLRAKLVHQFVRLSVMCLLRNGFVSLSFGFFFHSVTSVKVLFYVNNDASISLQFFSFGEHSTV